MVLGARLLTQVLDVNHFDSVSALQMNAGDAVTVYLQLLDISLDQDKVPRGRRYVAASGALLTAIIQHVDDAKKIVKPAYQAFPTTDPSIWAFNIYSTDVSVRGTVDLVITLQEGTVVHNARLQGAIRVTPIVPVELYPNNSGNIWNIS